LLIIPAIDLRRGYCVRLLRGDPKKETIYSEDPVQVALEWQKLGARYLHVVDLDGAFCGKTANGAAIERIASEITIPFQLGGGMRSRKSVEEAFELGVTKVIVGTIAVENHELLKELLEAYPGRIVVGLDARDGKVSVNGWTKDTVVDAVELSKKLESYGVKEIIYTDINRDGTLQGPNIEAIQKLASSTGLSVIASGGITRVSELQELKSLQDCIIKGAIIGKALYSGRLTLPEALAAVNNS
jgi:phosphoribosylformimino-5-aminoimidazole carboxamide ribotide isomerase